MKTKTFFRFFLLGVMTLFTLGAWAQPDKDYLCFTAETADAKVQLFKKNSPDAVNLQYSRDGSAWTEYTIGTDVTFGNVGDKVYFRNTGTATSFSKFEDWLEHYYQFKMSGKVSASGNVMSLVDKDCITTDISAGSYKYCFLNLFKDCTSLVSAPTLPAEKLAANCYESMFSGCTSLETAPALPAEILAEKCYNSMFFNCTSIETAPELPATTLASSCYSSMFSGCTSLKTAPALPATTLASSCYSSMFSRCTDLKAAPVLPATTLASSCYNCMFDGCKSLEAAPALPATTLASSCYGSMFSGCTGIEKAPALPATTLESYCYSYMFSGCTSLEAVPELPAMHLPDNCYYGMFRLCTKLTKAELPATTFENPQNGAYQYMFYGCNNLNYVKVAFTKWANTMQWLQDVAATGTFVCPAELDVTTRDADHVPAGWTVNPDYLCITAEQAGAKVQLIKQSNPTAVTIEYSTDEGATWTTVDYSSVETTGDITLTNIGDKVYFRNAKEAKDVEGFSTSSDCYYYFKFSANVSVSGNIMSLVDKNVETTTTIPCDYCFYSLFNECETLTNAADLKLPATALKPYCYENMFSSCSSLETAPTLPAEELAEGCYSRMFSDCEALKTAPELPATTLAPYCYESMFLQCTSLKTAPELPATTLAPYCYESMFLQCTSLKTAPELPATTLAEGCYSGMFSGCVSLEYLKVGFKEWYDDLGATNGWLEGAAKNITFVCPIELDTETTRDESHVPAGYTVKKFADEFTFDDATAHTATNDIECESLTYKRTFAAKGQYEALYLPFSVTMTSDLSDKVTIAKIYMVSTKGSVVGGDEDAGVDVVVVKTLGEGESTKPHTPYFIRSNDGIDLEFTQDNTTVYAATGVLPPQGYITCATTMDSYDFIGSYIVSSLNPEGNEYVLQNGGLHKVTEAAKLHCNRWKMVKTPTRWNDNYVAPSAKAKMQIITLGEDETTGIIGLDARMGADSTDDTIYTPAGVAVRKQQLTPGLYIQHGKKFIVK